MAKKKHLTENHKRSTIVITALVVVALVATLYSYNQKLKGESQALKDYISETTGLGKNIRESNVLVTNQNKIYSNKFLGITFEMPVGWYFDEQSSLTSDTFRINGTNGFMAIYNTSDQERVYSHRLQRGEYVFQLSAGLRQEDVDISKAENVSIDGKQTLKIETTFVQKGPKNNTERTLVSQKYYFTYRTLNFVLAAKSPAEGSPDFKQFTQLIQSLRLEE